VNGHPSPAPLPRWRVFLKRISAGLLVFYSVLAAVLILILPILPGERTVSLELDDVSTQEIVAPRAVTYISSVLTRQARDQAAAQVAPVYDPPDPRIARQQAEALQIALAYIANVRADTYASKAEKLADLGNLTQIDLDEQTATQILNLSDLEWELVQRESKDVLERIMRRQIQPGDLEDTRSSIPADVSFAIPEQHAVIVAQIVQDLVVPNSLYNETATAARREQTAAAVAPVSRSFVPGQVVVTRGKIVTEADLEAVASLGLITESLNVRTATSMTLAVILLTVLLLIFVARFHPEIGRTIRPSLLLALLLLVFLVAARVLVPGHTIIPYLLPVPALAMVVASLFGQGLGILVGMLFASLAGMIGGNALDLALYCGLSSLTAVLLLGKGEKPVQFFLSSLAASLTGIAVILATHLQEPATDMTGIATLTGASLANGLLSGSLALGLLLLLGLIFDVTTNLHLLELSRPDHPLLREILLNAPGTYQHSLQVANLAEYAGERIGANTMLLRVGALYHDAGKALQPKFFVENQGSDANPHDRLDPEASAKLIIQHTKDGLALARKHRLPSVVADLIVEHHGTLRTNFQYSLALKAAGDDPAKVDETHFRYGGPRPRSREAAILMLADGVEAKFRAVSPTTPEDIDALVRNVIEDRLSQHQFDETDITLHDLDRIRQAFSDALRGRIHGRLRYPDDEKIPKGKPDGKVV
jgi:cyclic-di-AMP phosphodiesterase PgpH